MIDKVVAERKKRYDQLHVLLADPKVLANAAEYQAYARELAGLKPMIDEYVSYQKMHSDLKELEKVLNDKTHDKEFLVMAEEEKHRLEKALKESGLRLEEMVLEKESGGERSIILEIRAGTGGLEASLFAGDLLRMYSKYAAKNGWKVELIDSSISEKGGYK